MFYSTETFDFSEPSGKSCKSVILYIRALVHGRENVGYKEQSVSFVSLDSQR